MQLYPLFNIYIYGAILIHSVDIFSLHEIESIKKHDSTLSVSILT